MRNYTWRLALMAAVSVGGVALLMAGLAIALGVRSAGAGPGSALPASPPNPGHSWSEIGDLPGTMWHSNNDGPGSGLDADTLDGLQSTQIQDADDYVSNAGYCAASGNADTLDGQHASAFAGASHSHNASDINAGTLSTDRYGAYTDLSAEGYLGNEAGDLARNNGVAQASLNADLLDGAHANQIQDADDYVSNAGYCTAAGNADTLDGQHGSYYRSATNINAGTLDPGYYSAYSDLSVEGYLADDAGDLARNNGALQSTLNADLLDGRQGTGYWSTAGNTGAGNWLGTTDNQALELYVNSARALRLEPNGTSPNVIGGYGGNSVTAGVVGAAIGGGGDSAWVNRVTDNHGTVGGGEGNRVGNDSGGTDDAPFATVGGGWYNIASGGSSTVGGGTMNTAGGSYATVDGGSSNLASATLSTVGGGWYNTASGQDSTISGGYSNDAINIRATVAGGSDNTASGQYSSIGGGGANTASAYGSTVAGGIWNLAGDYYATVAGGSGNTAAWGATVPGGVANTAAGNYSLAAGRRAKANSVGCFVWGDSTDADVACNNDNRFVVRASGGVYLYTSGDLSTGAALGPGSGTWSSHSDRNLKNNFTPVDGQDVLPSLAEIPIATWNYKAQDASIRHMGPTAQDFYAAFGLGESDTAIGTVDADGVALAAIHGLYEIVQGLEAENASLQQQLDDLDARVTALEGGAPLERGSESLLSSVTPGGWLVLGALLVLGGLVVLAQRRLAGGRP